MGQLLSHYAKTYLAVEEKVNRRTVNRMRLYCVNGGGEGEAGPHGRSMLWALLASDSLLHYTIPGVILLGRQNKKKMMDGCIVNVLWLKREAIKLTKQWPSHFYSNACAV